MMTILSQLDLPSRSGHSLGALLSRLQQVDDPDGRMVRHAGGDVALELRVVLARQQLAHDDRTLITGREGRLKELEAIDGTAGHSRELQVRI